MPDSEGPAPQCPRRAGTTRCAAVRGSAEPRRPAAHAGGGPGAATAGRSAVRGDDSSISSPCWEVRAGNSSEQGLPGAVLWCRSFPNVPALRKPVAGLPWHLLSWAHGRGPCPTFVFSQTFASWRSLLGPAIWHLCLDVLQDSWLVNSYEIQNPCFYSGCSRASYTCY